MMSLKKFLATSIFDSVFSQRVIAPYLFFWARLIIVTRKPVIVGVTGSVGKTTTKDMIAAVLTHPDAAPIVGSVAKSPESLNEDIGLPMTLLGYDDVLSVCRRKKLVQLCVIPFRAVARAVSRRYPRVLVLEYGTCWHGHLHRLAKLAPPHVAAVTTIGPAHLERLKTLEGVVYEKSAIVRAVPPTGLVILGEGHDYVSDFERAARAPVVKVAGRGPELSRNIARAVGRHFKIPDETVSTALKDFKLPKGRLNRLELCGLTVIDDTYNANPLSMKLGLDTLADMAKPGQRRFALLGAMAELGVDSPQYHQEVGAYARSRVDVMIGVGEFAKHYKPDQWFENSDACANHVESLVRPGDCLLVKGSHSLHMEQIVEKLRRVAQLDSASHFESEVGA